MGKGKPTLEYGKEEPLQGTFQIWWFFAAAIGIAIILGCAGIWLIGYFYPHFREI